MSAILTTQCHHLAESLAELKVKVRAALATELAGAVGAAVRDVLLVALVERLVVPPWSVPSANRGWREDEYDRDRWDEDRDPWSESDDDATRDRTSARYALEEREDSEPTAGVPALAAVAVGVNVGRWWLARKGTVGVAVGFGALATALGLAGGPGARAALAVLAAATDVLTAESALARPNST